MNEFNKDIKVLLQSLISNALYETRQGGMKESTADGLSTVWYIYQDILEKEERSKEKTKQ